VIEYIKLLRFKPRVALEAEDAPNVDVGRFWYLSLLEAYMPPFYFASIHLEIFALCPSAPLPRIDPHHNQFSEFLASICTQISISFTNQQQVSCSRRLWFSGKIHRCHETLL